MVSIVQKAQTTDFRKPSELFREPCMTNMPVGQVYPQKVGFKAMTQNKHGLQSLANTYKTPLLC